MTETRATPRTNFKAMAVLGSAAAVALALLPETASEGWPLFSSGERAGGAVPRSLVSARCRTEQQAPRDSEVRRRDEEDEAWKSYGLREDWTWKSIGSEMRSCCSIEISISAAGGGSIVR